MAQGCAIWKPVLEEVLAMDSAQWIVWVVQDLNNLEITFDYTSPIHLPCPMSATTLQETAGQLFIESCLDGMNCPSLVALRIWFFFNVFLPLRIRNEGQCMASTVIGTWIIHVTLHSQRLFTLGLTGCSNPPVHIIWTFMLGGIYFSSPTEENSTACSGSFLRPGHSFHVWPEALCSEDNSSSCLCCSTALAPHHLGISWRI